MRGNMFRGESTTDDGLSQDRIGRRDASRDGEACEEFEMRDDSPHQKRCDEPSPLRTPEGFIQQVRKDKVPCVRTYGHNGSDEKHQRLPVMLDIFL
jgi:hypothetical protein